MPRLASIAPLGRFCSGPEMEVVAPQRWVRTTLASVRKQGSANWGNVPAGRKGIERWQKGVVGVMEWIEGKCCALVPRDLQVLSNNDQKLMVCKTSWSTCCDL